MTSRAEVEDWVRRYVGAWESNEPADIAGLFTDDARYFTAPDREPWRGRDGIVAGWLGRKDVQGEWTFSWDILAVDGNIACVRGRTSYAKLPDYSNLWVVRLEDDGRASEFTEWWMEVEEK